MTMRTNEEMLAEFREFLARTLGPMPALRAAGGPATAAPPVSYTEPWANREEYAAIPEEAAYHEIACALYHEIGLSEGNGQWYADYALPETARAYQEQACELADDYLSGVWDEIQG